VLLVLVLVLVAIRPPRALLPLRAPAPPRRRMPRRPGKQRRFLPESLCEAAQRGFRVQGSGFRV